MFLFRLLVGVVVNPCVNRHCTAVPREPRTTGKCLAQLSAPSYRKKQSSTQPRRNHRAAETCNIIKTMSKIPTDATCIEPTISQHASCHAVDPEPSANEGWALEVQSRCDVHRRPHSGEDLRKGRQGESSVWALLLRPDAMRQILVVFIQTPGEPPQHLPC